MSSAGDYSRFNKIPGATKAHATHAPHVSLEISKGPTIGPSDPEKGEDEGTAIDVGKRHAATGLFFGCEILRRRIFFPRDMTQRDRRIHFAKRYYNRGGEGERKRARYAAAAPDGFCKRIPANPTIENCTNKRPERAPWLIFERAR